MKKCLSLSLSLLLLLFAFQIPRKPIIYIIGDSTVKNGSGRGDRDLWGWGSFITDYFDTAKIGVENNALGGRSSRTFITEGRWQKVLEKLHSGDYVLLQFGHNDGGNIADSLKPRGSIKGVGEDSLLIYNHQLNKDEYVHSYGWYIQKIVSETKEKGAIPIVVSYIPRNIFKDDKVLRGNDSYGLWARQIAEKNRVPFLDLNNIVGDKYDALGPETVKKFFPGDHTHTNKAGAELNASLVIKGLNDLGKEQAVLKRLAAFERK